MSPPPVIAVSGPPGGGKSTLARALAARLGGAPVVAYDDYEGMTARPPAAVEAWLRAGGDVATIPLPGFAEAVARLRRGESVPADGRAPALRPGPTIVLDTLVGRAHPAGAGADLLFWIEAPLDVALARKLRRVVLAARKGPGAAGLPEWLDAYLAHYPGFVRASYLMQKERVAPAADLVLDGLAPASDLAERAHAEVRRRFPDLPESPAPPSRG